MPIAKLLANALQWTRLLTQVLVDPRLRAGFQSTQSISYASRISETVLAPFQVFPTPHLPETFANTELSDAQTLLRAC
jgi:hypothetical protein